MDADQERAHWREVGRRLRDARERRQMTLEGVADALDGRVTFGGLGHYETGRRPLPVPTAIMLARLLHTSAAYLLCVDNVTLHDDEIRLLESFRKLPLADRTAYLERIEGLAKIYGKPVPHERLPAVFRDGPKPQPKPEPKVKRRTK